MSTTPPSPGLSKALENTVEHTRDLLLAELALAKQDVVERVHAWQMGVLALLLGFSLLQLAAGVLIAAAVLYYHESPLVTACIGLALLIVAAVSVTRGLDHVHRLNPKALGRRVHREIDKVKEVIHG